VLIACEFSGIVRDAFIAAGHDAVSCDLLPSERPGPHIQGDVLEVLEDGWDMLIAFPPCTYLCSSGLHWNKRRPERAQQTHEAMLFVFNLLGEGFISHDIPRIALENPIGCISTNYRKPDQIIQPWMFGHDASKATCLWLKNLWPLVQTDAVEPMYGCCGARFPYALGKYGCPNCNGDKVAKAVWGNQTPSGQNNLGPSDTRAMERSRTYQGIADAMAEQWGRVTA
jgi:hypothetical protein